MSDTADSRADFLQQEVEALAQPEGRVLGSRGHEVARQHLETRLRSLQFVPYRGDTFSLPYRTAGLDGCNLIAFAPGLDASLPPLLLGAHYDSALAAPCAGDNAAGVAVVLAIGDHFRRMPTLRGLILALFDAEESGYYQTPLMGSVRFLEDQLRPEGLLTGIILDLVGHDVPVPTPTLEILVPHFRQLLFVIGAESHSQWPVVVETSRLPDLPVLATTNRRVGDVSDHRAFRRASLPYLFLTCGRWPHYHQETDTPDRLNYDKLARVSDFVTRLIDRLAPSRWLVEPTHTDTTAFELRLLRETLGESGVAALAQAVGLTQVSSEADLDVLAMRLQAYFDL